MSIIIGQGWPNGNVFFVDNDQQIITDWIPDNNKSGIPTTMSTSIPVNNYWDSQQWNIKWGHRSNDQVNNNKLPARNNKYHQQCLYRIPTIEQQQHHQIKSSSIHVTITTSINRTISNSSVIRHHHNNRGNNINRRIVGFSHAITGFNNTTPVGGRSGLEYRFQQQRMGHQQPVNVINNNTDNQ